MICWLYSEWISTNRRLVDIHSSPEDQDWIDEITLQDEKKIIEIIMQPNQFCQTCWYWLDMIVNGVDEVDQ